MILSILGNSDVGKTTLISRIVPILKVRGLKVVVIKHTHKDVEVDVKEKDSWKIFKSGADVILSSPGKLAFIRNEEDNLDKIVSYLEEYDLILTEGFNRAGKDRIVVIDNEEELERFKNGKILAVVSDNAVTGYRTFRKDDVEEIANFILSLLKDSLQGQTKRAENQAF
jgi:molybdopterin-guanine dinucleotide biosynthesis protein B